jgi:hypothetical protein
MPSDNSGNAFRADLAADNKPDLTLADSSQRSAYVFLVTTRAQRLYGAKSGRIRYWKLLPLVDPLCQSADPRVYTVT